MGFYIPVRRHLLKQPQWVAPAEHTELAPPRRGPLSRPDVECLLQTDACTLTHMQITQINMTSEVSLLQRVTLCRRNV